ncbi:carbohydrate-binding domain-containing protein [Carboxylicivirga caseinilyticus]|uniref:carbohydrate-binding domain-containing protein n=1 Tax=Carboxylicivirga caseinilyticus TaxID=3417572 RepID=UPI003D342DE0|nr:carbohydrate-binding domain-containing protein [Marinilabiliaceae bacterium A049]
MKKILLLICILSLGAFVKAQQYIHFYNQNTPETYELFESDSMYFSNDQSTLYFINNGTVISKITSDIDSISFTRNNSYNIYINYDGSSVSIINPLADQGVSITTEGAYVTVSSTMDTKDINYICSGTTSNGMLKVYSLKRFNILLNGVNITNPVGPAINIQTDTKATIHLVAGTSNFLADGATYNDPVITEGEEEDQKAALFSEAKLVFIGGGSLDVTGYGEDQHAIRSDDEIIINEGNINVISSVKDGIHAADGFYMYGGNLDITASGDGIDGDEGVVEIQNGSVVINSLADDVKAIACDSTMSISNSVIELTILGDQSKGLKSKQPMQLINCSITGTAAGATVLEASGSGYDPSYCTFIKSDDDLILTGTTIDITTKGMGSRGISGDANVLVNSVTITIVSSGNGTTYTNEEGVKDAYHGSCMSIDGDLTINGGTLSLSNSGTGGRGISVDGSIYYGDGSTSPQMDVTTTGSSIVINQWQGDYDEAKAIKADESITISSGILTVSSADDGIKAENSVIINGGLTDIQKSVEGIEAPYITINDGEVRVKASDDCFNATFGNGGEGDDGSKLYINNGSIYLSGTGGDALDSNGSMAISGGTILVHGPQSSPEVGMDVNGSSVITGGFILISGTNSNMTYNFTSGSTQPAILFKTNTRLNAGSLIHLEDSNGNDLFTFAPERNYYSIIFSSDELSTGTTYKLYTGGSYSGDENDGLYTNGSYTSGSLRKTFTISSTISTVTF